MGTFTVRNFAASTAALVLFATGAQSTDDDPPDRVGRVSAITGEVSFRPGDSDDWSAAELNDPVTTGDGLWTDANARAEVSFADGSVRLAPSTAFSLLTLDDEMTQMRVAEGSIALHASEVDSDDQFEIDTPNGAVTVIRPGSYRVDVSPDGDSTLIVVRSGEVEVTAAGSSYRVQAGEASTIVGLDAPVYDVFRAPVRSAMEDWASTRNRRQEIAVTAHYVPRDMIGYEDLDSHGDWETVPDYGPAWFPRNVAADWAPYRSGHWKWVRVWGWTWVDDEPWGFAPFHYGRWAQVRSRWCWVPGEHVQRPVYAPALVAFLGGSNFSVGVSVGGGPQVGWFPLAPREAFIPAYRTSERYRRQVNVNVTNVNVTNVNVTNINYVNKQAPGAVTVVSQQTFVRAQPVQHVIQRVDQRQLATVQVASVAAVAPTKESVSPRPIERRPPPTIITRQVVVKTAPPPAPTPFAAKQQALQASHGRPVEPPTEVKEVVRPSAANPQPANPLVRANAVHPAQPARPQDQSRQREARPPETRPPETRPPETRPPETRPPETRPPETRPPTTRPPETRPAETRPAETRPAETRRPTTQPEPPQLRPRRPDVRPVRPAEPPPPPAARPATPTPEQERLLQQQAEERNRIEQAHRAQLRAKPAPDTAARRKLIEEDRTIQQRQRQARESMRRPAPPPAPPPSAAERRPPPAKADERRRQDTTKHPPRPPA
jgi:hypothetical protein